jgi:hypothetical protein
MKAEAIASASLLSSAITPITVWSFLEPQSGRAGFDRETARLPSLSLLQAIDPPPASCSRPNLARRRPVTTRARGLQ